MSRSCRSCSLAAGAKAWAPNTLAAPRARGPKPETGPRRAPGEAGRQGLRAQLGCTSERPGRNAARDQDRLASVDQDRPADARSGPAFCAGRDTPPAKAGNGGRPCPASAQVPRGTLTLQSRLRRDTRGREAARTAPASRSRPARVRRLGPGRAPGPSRAPLVRPPHAARAASEREPPRATPRPDSGWCTRGLRPCTLSSILVRPVIPAPSSPPPSPGHCETPRYCNDDGPGPGGRGARRGRVARECSEGAGGLVLVGDAWGDGWRSRVGPDRSLPTGRRHGAGCAGRRLTRMLRDAWRDGGVPGGARRGSPAVIVIERERSTPVGARRGSPSAPPAPRP